MSTAHYAVAIAITATALLLSGCGSEQVSPTPEAKTDAPEAVEFEGFVNYGTPIELGDDPPPELPATVVLKD